MNKQPQIAERAIHRTVSARQIVPETSTVVVVHGIASRRFDMYMISRRLRNFGYDVINWGYPSTRKTIAYHGTQMRERLHAAAESGRENLHIVAHSMGCIVSRCALADADQIPEKFSRLVMLAPPNQGSFVARNLTPWLGWYSTTLTELSDDDDSFVNQLPPLSGVEFGVMAAERDRVIERSKTLLPGMADFTIVNTGHGIMPWNHQVAKLTHKFLLTGRF